MRLLLSEKLLVLAGLGMLASLPLLVLAELFELWIAAKVLYGAGALLFLLDR